MNEREAGGQPPLFWGGGRPVGCRTGAEGARGGCGERVGERLGRARGGEPVDMRGCGALDE